MNEEQKDYAFPIIADNNGSVHDAGMELRDWFAGMALSSWSPGYIDKTVAESCYRLADAMMEARKTK